MIGWACLSCEAKGETTGTESGADVKHMRTAGHPTTTAATRSRRPSNRGAGGGRVVSDWAQRAVQPCLECGRVMQVEARGLCGACYQRNRKADTLVRYPRRFLPSADLAEDYDFLRREGYTRAQAAERMGITKKRLEKAIERHTRRLTEAI